MRAEFESGTTTSSRALAEKYGCDEKAVRLQAAKQDQDGGPWQRPPAIRQQISRAVGKAIERVKKNRHPNMEVRAEIATKLRERQGAIAEFEEKPEIIIEELTIPENSAEPDIIPPPDQIQTPHEEAQTPREDISPIPPQPDPGEPQPVEQHPLYNAAALDVTLSMQDRMLGDAVRSMVAVNLAHLDERVEPLKKLFNRHMELLTEAMKTPDDDDDDGKASRDRAVRTLLSGGRDSISGQISALVKLSESIQQQERKALGLEPGPSRGSRKPGDVAGEVGRPGDAATAAPSLPDLSTMATEQLEALYQAAVVLEGTQGRPPILLPPERRAVIDAEQEAEPPSKD